MNSDRIDEILMRTAYPKSNSVRQAMMQVWNETQQNFNSRTCKNCKYSGLYTMGWMPCIYKYNSLIIKDVHDDFGCINWESK